eukprot:COSAG05_NODE_6137_length_1015_cov_1.140830_1_plen_274_part_01
MPRTKNDGAPHRVTSTNEWLHDWPGEASQPVCDLVQLPFFEAAAKQLLRAERVFHSNNSLVVSYPAEGCAPQPGKGEASGHIDQMLTLEELEATPRRCVLSFFVWIAEATPLRGPLMYRPGSHRLIAARNSATGTDSISRNGETTAFPDLAELDGSGLQPEQFAKAVPAVGRAGSCTLTTTCVVHGASLNHDTVPRLSAHITFAECSFVERGHEGTFRFRKRPAERHWRLRLAKQRYWQALHARFRPERRHICCLQESWAEDPENATCTVARL